MVYQDCLVKIPRTDQVNAGCLDQWGISGDQVHKDNLVAVPLVTILGHVDPQVNPVLLVFVARKARRVIQGRLVPMVIKVKMVYLVIPGIVDRKVWLVNVATKDQEGSMDHQVKMAIQVWTDNQVFPVEMVGQANPANEVIEVNQVFLVKMVDQVPLAQIIFLAITIVVTIQKSLKVLLGTLVTLDEMECLEIKDIKVYLVKIILRKVPVDDLVARVILDPTDSVA